MHDAPTCGSLFSGAGLLDAGLALAGFEHAWFCESDEFRRGLLASRFPGAVVYDDIRTLRGQAAADTDGRRCEEQSQLNGQPEHGQPEREHRGHPVGHRMENGSRRDQTATDADEPRADAHAEASGSRCPVGKRALGAVAVDLIAGGFPCKGASSAGKQNGFEHAETVLWHEMRRVIGEVGPRYVLIENVAAILGMAAAPGEPPGSLWGVVLRDLAALGFCSRWDCVPSAAVGAPHLRDRVFLVAERSGIWPM